MIIFCCTDFELITDEAWCCANTSCFYLDLSSMNFEIYAYNLVCIREWNSTRIWWMDLFVAVYGVNNKKYWSIVRFLAIIICALKRFYKFVLQATYRASCVPTVELINLFVLIYVDIEVQMSFHAFWLNILIFLLPVNDYCKLKPYEVYILAFCVLWICGTDCPK